jgi:microsomal epoxide hydrolase
MAFDGLRAGGVIVLAIATAIASVTVIASEAPRAFPPALAPTSLIEEGTIRGGSIRIGYLECRSDTSKAALVLVPGWGMDASVWKFQMKALCGSRPILALDPRSQGASQQVDSDNSPEARAADIRAAIADRGFDRVVLVGWSQGVQDVLAYIDRFGTGALAGLVLVDASPSPGFVGVVEDPRASAEMLSMISMYESTPEAYLRGMAEAVFRRSVTDQDKQRIVAAARRTPVSIGASMMLQAHFGIDRRSVLKKIDRPVLVVASDRAPDFEAQSAASAEIADADLLIMEGTGHAPFIEQPEVFNASLTKFLESLEGRAQ